MIGWVQQAFRERNRPTPRAIPASLFTQSEDFGLDEIPFDLLIDESHELGFDITDHAVENGAIISDSVQRRLRSVTVRGMFTNHPVKKASGFTVDKDGNVTKPGKVSIEDGDGNEALTNSARDEKWKALNEIAERKGTVRLVTALEIYDEMAIESIQADRGSEDGESIQFTLVLREIRSVALLSTGEGGTWTPAKQTTWKERVAARKKQNGKVSAEEIEAEKKLDDLARMKGGTVAAEGG